MQQIVLAELAGSAQYGGGERYLELLFAGLDRTRYRPMLICPESGPFVEVMQTRDVPTTVVHLSPLVNLAALFRLTRLLACARVTVLQTHGARSNVYGRLAGRLARVPVVISTVHNSLRDYEVGVVRKSVYELAFNWTNSLADRIICVSESLRNDLLTSHSAMGGRTLVVRNGISSTELLATHGGKKIRAEFHIGHGPLVVTVGRLTEPKGHQYLIQALPNLLCRWPDLRCLIVGDGALMERLTHLVATLGLERVCLFAGKRNDIQDILGAADMVVLPSVSEGFPFVLLEAMAASRAVVATQVNGVPELIEDRVTGRLVPPRDSAALARAIQELLENPMARKAMAQNGHQRVRERFTAERMVRETVSVFESALAERNHPCSLPKSIAA